MPAAGKGHLSVLFPSCLFRVPFGLKFSLGPFPPFASGTLPGPSFSRFFGLVCMQIGPAVEPPAGGTDRWRSCAPPEVPKRARRSLLAFFPQTVLFLARFRGRGGVKMCRASLGPRCLGS